MIGLMEIIHAPSIFIYQTRIYDMEPLLYTDRDAIIGKYIEFCDGGGEFKSIPVSRKDYCIRVFLVLVYLKH